MAIHLCLEQAPGPLTDRQADLLYAARADCERLQSIVDELLDLARIQAGQIRLAPQSTPPAGIVGTALAAQQALAGERHIQLERAVLPGLSEVRVDRDRVQLVFSNLLVNAIRHSPPRATVTVRALPAQAGVRFEVTDAGPGIPKDLQAVVFDRFFQVP